MNVLLSNSFLIRNWDKKSTLHIFIAVLVASRLLDTSGQEEQREETDVPNSEMHTGREQTKVKSGRTWIGLLLQL